MTAGGSVACGRGQNDAESFAVGQPMGHGGVKARVGQPAPQIAGAAKQPGPFGQQATTGCRWVIFCVRAGTHIGYLSHAPTLAMVESALSRET